MDLPWVSLIGSGGSTGGWIAGGGVSTPPVSVPPATVQPPRLPQPIFPWPPLGGNDGGGTPGLQDDPTADDQGLDDQGDDQGTDDAPEQPEEMPEPPEAAGGAGMGGPDDLDDLDSLDESDGGDGDESDTDESEPCEPGDSEPDGEPEMEAEPIYGMEITGMSEGPAQAASMKVGDIIMAINGMPTPDFDALRAALEASGPEAEIDFINVDSGELERIAVTIEDTRLGVDVQQVIVEQANDD